MNQNKSLDSFNSLKDSYFNILASFLEKDEIESRFVRCLLKWGFQLKLTPQDILLSNIELSSIQFIQPASKIDRLEAIFHLVQMIYLDQTVEDVELELAGVYAERMGFKKEVVAELFKSIATESTDEQAQKDVHQEVIDFLTLNERWIN
jgi:hypothetical protein